MDTGIICILEGCSKTTVMTIDYKWLCVLEGNDRSEGSSLDAISLLMVVWTMVIVVEVVKRVVRFWI